MSDTLTMPELSDIDTGEGNLIAHYARKITITQAVIEGGKLQALCGVIFEPIHDVKGLQVCGKCQEIYDSFSK